MWYALRVLTFLALIFFIPLGVGLAFWSNNRKGLAFTLLYGVCVSLALFELIYLPICFTAGRLSVLTAIYLPLTLLLAGYGFFRFYRERRTCVDCPALFEKPAFSPREKKLFAAVLTLVLLQALRMVLCATDMAWDDAFYLVAANEAVDTDLLWAVNPETGLAMDFRFLGVAYTLAPWPMLWAVFSSLLNIHPAILFRTILPAPLTLLYYLSLWCIFKFMFKDNKEKSMLSLIFAVLITNILATDQCLKYFWMSFMPWFGKPASACIICPTALLFFLTLFETEGKAEKRLLWLGVFFGSFAAACVATTGSILTLLGFGCWGLAYIIMKRDFSLLWKISLCVSPSILQLTAVYLKGGL